MNSLLTQLEEALKAGTVTQAEVLQTLHNATLPLPWETLAAVNRARNEYADDDTEIDAAPLFSEGEDGTWVSAWVWVAAKEENETLLHGMTLDEAIIAFRENPCDDTAIMLRSVAHEYEGDEMISETEMWDLIGWSDGGVDPFHDDTAIMLRSVAHEYEGDEIHKKPGVKKT